MKKEFVPYDRALKLKQLGFDEEGFGTYNANREVLPLMPYTTESKAILFQQAFRWFREELKYEVFLQKQENLISGKTYSFLIENDLEGIYNRSLSKSSIDKAELACLDKLIEIVIKQQEQ
jgi:hypothetical protein